MDTRELARTLGWASLGLGVPMNAAPGRFARAIGVRDDAEARTWTFVVGLREYAAAGGILVLEWPRPKWSLWGRVAGDAMDLALLLSARGKRTSTPRWTAATLATVATGALDLLAATRSTARDDEAVHDDRAHVTAATTVRRPVEEVERYWRTVWQDGDGPASRWEPRFSKAPGERGTEVIVEADREAPLPGPVAKVVAETFEQQVKTELLRFKQVLETGEVVRSDGSPEGPEAARLLKQRPAHPLAAGSAS